MRKETVKIVICKNCEGTGGTIRYAKVDTSNCVNCMDSGCFAKRNNLGCLIKKEPLVHNVCNVCNGSGRLQMTFITEPYKDKETPVVHDGLYPCDPNKHTRCNKKDCYLQGGSCSQTMYKEFSIGEDK